MLEMVYGSLQKVWQLICFPRIKDTAFMLRDVLMHAFLTPVAPSSISQIFFI